LLALVQILFGPKKVVPSSQDQFLDLWQYERYTC
jgi:hypothetical protein